MKIKIVGLLHMEDGHWSEPTANSEMYLHVNITSRRVSDSILYNLRTRESFFFKRSLQGAQGIGNRYLCDEGTKQLLDDAFAVYIKNEIKTQFIGNHRISVECFGAQ